MDFSIKILLIFLSLFGENLSQHLFSFIPINEKIQQGFFVSPTLTENYLYIVTGENINNNDIKKRYILIYDINSASLIKCISYESQFNYTYGDSFSIGNNNSPFLFLNTFESLFSYSSFEIFDTKEQIAMQRYDYSIKGYNRPFINADPYYYLIYIDENDFLIIQKMKIAYSHNYPYFEDFIFFNSDFKVKNQAAISCDITKDKNYILCSFIDDDSYYKIIVIDNQLELKYTNQLDKNSDYINNNFTKIINFKGNSNFVMIYTQNKIITRLRYFSYENNKIVDKLSSLIKSDNDYLDIKNTQYKGDFLNNDIISINSDKIIKIYNDDIKNEIIITIIQFNDNDPSLSIKIYNLYNDDSNLYKFYRARISILKDSFVVLFSALMENKRKPGYFIANYPNSTDINLVQSNILVKKLISLENPIFNIKLKLRILRIPKEFIFINKLNSKIINENDELELNDEIILRQYRVNTGSYTLEFESIARGFDTGYSYSYIYPTDKILNNKVLLEGRKGKIIINLKDCLSGYYHLYGNMYLCTNIKPKNYYIDEINKTYKPCSSFCDECNPPTKDYPMNCINCMNNYSMTEDTYSCYIGDIDNYYLDKEKNKYKRCHPNCLRCDALPILDNMHCTKCQPNYYKIENIDSCYNYIPEHYYLDGNILKSCHESCLNCYGKWNNTTTNCMNCISNEYFYRNDTYNCIKISEYEIRNNVEFKKFNNVNFYVFIALFIASIILFILLIILCKKKEKRELITERTMELAELEKYEEEG